MDIKVSIITANYNKARFINETIESVIGQTYSNWELIIVDDFSTDNSIEVIKRFTDERIKLSINTKNQGANVCRNQGIFLAKGEYFMFLDADDILLSGCLMERVKLAMENRDKNLIVFTMGVFRKKVGDSSGLWKPESQNPLKDFLQHKLPWSILQPFWRRDLLLELNGFDESFKRLQDVELNTRALLNFKCKHFLVVDKPDCFYRIDEKRKNFDANEFLQRWVDSALNYCYKFEKTLPENLTRYLYGTIYETYLPVIHHYKLNLISVEEFKLREAQLLESKIMVNNSWIRTRLFKISRFYNLYCFRIPGVNKLLKVLVVC